MLEWTNEFINKNFYIVVFAVIFCLLLALTIKMCLNNWNEEEHLIYGYAEINGPHTWKAVLGLNRNANQSPINLIPESCTVLSSHLNPKLTFTGGYYTEPCELILINDSHSIALCAFWDEGIRRPSVTGGPTIDSFAFCKMRFRWGGTDAEGSEHMIASRQYAMELQVMYERSGPTNCQPSRDNSGTLNTHTYPSYKNSMSGILIISYLFDITCADNPCLEEIVNNLRYVKEPCTECSIAPTLLVLLAPAFTRNYYTYVGSLTYPPCTEGVRWIVQSEPLGISSRQIQKFRKISSFDGILSANIRPVQNINHRNVLYIE